MCVRAVYSTEVCGRGRSQHWADLFTVGHYRPRSPLGKADRDVRNKHNYTLRLADNREEEERERGREAGRERGREVFGLCPLGRLGTWNRVANEGQQKESWGIGRMGEVE